MTCSVLQLECFVKRYHPLSCVLSRGLLDKSLRFIWMAYKQNKPEVQVQSQEHPKEDLSTQQSSLLLVHFTLITQLWSVFFIYSSLQRKPPQCIPAFSLMYGNVSAVANYFQNTHVT